MINGKIKNWTFISLFLVFLFLQVTFIPQLFFDNYIPNIVLALLLAVSALDNRSINIFYAAFVTGFVLDIFSGNYFGLIIISILFTIFISSYLNYYFLKELFSYNLFLVASLAILIYNTTYIFLISIGDFGQIFFNLKQFLLIIVFQIIYTVILIYPLAHILSRKTCN
ncbi:MAG: rod shape-determining protein MreD [Candidatus Pacebacteria bacterium]|nr:rod shape-determining protein MreD [Candidatus Paceibacterota bacterium]